LVQKNRHRRAHGEQGSRLTKKYFVAINGIIADQIEFSKAIAEIYKPISGQVSYRDSNVQEENPEDTKTREEYGLLDRRQGLGLSEL
jgi:hypothetical protein